MMRDLCTIMSSNNNTHLWKSLSPIYFFKIRPPDFLCNEFLIEMYRLLQKYTFEICFQNIPANIVSWLGKTILMAYYWPSSFVLRWMSVVRNLEIRNMVLLITSVNCWHVFCFGFLDKFDVCMIGKNYCIDYLYTQTSQIDCFRHESDVAIFKG